MHRLSFSNLTGCDITAFALPTLSLSSFKSSSSPSSSREERNKWLGSGTRLLEPCWTLFLPRHHTTTTTTAVDHEAGIALPRSRFREEVILSTENDEKGTDLVISISMPKRALWRCVDVPEGCRWRVYVMRVSRKHRRMIIMERRDLGSFMSQLADNLPLSSLSLPGTHDTMAIFGWPLSQCQTQALQVQLLGGIRVIDIRLAVIPPQVSLNKTVEPELIAYHGTWPQQTRFLSILNVVSEFLSSDVGRRETIVMSIKQEDRALTPPRVFSQMVREAVLLNRGMWFLENRIPRLGEVRGKVVMFSRFRGDDWPEGMGIEPPYWPDSRKEGFEWELNGTRIRTHDWYSIGSFFSIREKTELGTRNMTMEEGLPITFFSAVSIPFALPPMIAKGMGWPDWGLGFYGVNALLGKWLLTNKTSGWTLLDYYSEPEESVVGLLVESNFR